MVTNPASGRRVFESAKILGCSVDDLLATEEGG